MQLTLPFSTTESAVASSKLENLVSQWESRKLEILASNAVSSAVFEAADLDLINILAQILPYVLSLFTSGFSIDTLLGIVKFVIPLLVKDAQLQAILLQVIDVILKLLVKN